jgi:hypothetical protein
MGDNIHLRMVHKRAKGNAAEYSAAAGRLADGDCITDRAAELSRRAQARKSLDQHRIESGDGS